MLGYTVDNAGNPVIDEEQAEIVREIFRLYLTGLSERAIASTLIKMGIKTSTGKLSWSQKNIRIILENEKYKGDSRLQNTYTTSYLRNCSEITYAFMLAKFALCGVAIP